MPAWKALPSWFLSCKAIIPSDAGAPVREADECSDNRGTYHPTCRWFAGSRSASVSEDWLLSELPSPPIHKLWSEDYLGFFTNVRTREKPDKDSKRQIIPSPVRQALPKAVEERNNTVHAGLPPPDEEMLAECLAAVNDFLYALDWFAGQKWAFEHVREEVRNEWELGQA